MSQSRVTPISGFPEFLPGDRIVEQHFLDVIRETFELHGFASVETRAVEPIERLAGASRLLTIVPASSVACWPSRFTLSTSVITGSLSRTVRKMIGAAHADE